MRRKTSLFALATIVLSSSSAFSLTPVFVVSRPLDANVVVNGVPTADKTPVLYHLDGGSYEIAVTRPGYPAVSATVVVEGDDARRVNLDLETGGVRSRFLTDGPIVINGVSQPAGSSLLRVPYAGYEIRERNGSLLIDPVFHRQSLLDATNVLFLVSAAATIGAVIGDVISPDRPSLTVSTGVVAGSAATLTLAGLEVILRIQKRRFDREFAVEATVEEDSYVEAAPIYARAEDLLATGDLENALAGYTEVIAAYPDAPEYPQALYKSARIFSVGGELKLARVLYRHILNLEQHPEVYDKAAKQLADLAFLDEDYEKAIAYIDRMVFLDPILSSQDAEAYKTEIYEAWSQATGLSVQELRNRAARAGVDDGE